VDQDIYLQDAAGGAEQRLVLPGQDQNPSISGRFVAFQRRFPGAVTPNTDIALYDLSTQTLYRVTDTPEDEQLTDVWISDDAQRVNVVWSVRENGDDNVRALTFRAQPSTCTPPAAQTLEQICAEPGKRPLLVDLQLKSEKRAPWDARAEYSATGTGVFCLDNGYGGTHATAGLVRVDNQLVLMLETCRQDVNTIALEQPLSSTGSVYAAIAGAYGSAYRVRLYGELPACVPTPAAPLPSTSLYVTFVDARGVVYSGPVPLPGDKGCSSTGGGSALAALCLTLVLLRDRRVRVRARR
jgi:hypothetical protein